MGPLRWIWIAIAVAAAAVPSVPARAGDFADRHPGDAGYAAFDRAVDATKAAMTADPRLALRQGRVAADRARALPAGRDAALALATAQWLQAEALLRTNDLTATDPVIAAALATVARDAPDTKLHGDLIRARGAVAAARGRVQDALRDYQAAFRIFRAAGIARSQAIMLQDIGMIYWDAQDYERVLRYYAQANEIYHDDPEFVMPGRNNMGEVLRKLHRFGAAERQYALALAIARRLGSPLLEVRILGNLAVAQIEGHRLAAADANIARALRMARSGEAAGWRPMLLGAAAQLAAARGDDARAAALLGDTFAGADLSHTDLSYKDYHQLAAQVFERRGDAPLALAHLRAFARLDGDTRDLVTSTSSQLMSARFDYANQTLRISQLKRGQLERDIRIERQRAAFRNWLFGGLAVAGAIIVGILLALYLAIRRSRDRLALGNAALEKALAAKTEFLATTSHEIRTPLNGILGMTQVLLANRGLDHGVADQIRVVHGAGEAMKALVDDILDVAKMEAGEVAVADEPVDLPALLRETALLWTGHAAAKGIALDLDLAGAPAAVRTDPARLRQLVGNLLSNAVKFTGEGAVTLRCAAAGGRLRIAVADTGIGIPADQRDKVFEAFHQVDGGMNRQFSGTGLGLAICRNLAAALGGTIALDSTPGVGSTFTLDLPLVAAELPRRDPPRRLADARLLVVEGNLLAQGKLRGLLEAKVGALAFALDGAEAGGRLAQADLLMVDARAAAAPGGAPLDALAALLAAARAAGVRATVLLAPAADLAAEAVAALAPDRLLLKPIGAAALVAALAEGVEGAADTAPALAAAAGAAPAAGAG